MFLYEIKFDFLSFIVFKRNFPQVLQSLLDAGANINITNQKGTTAVHIAARKGQFDALHNLIKNGAEINTQVRQTV